MNLFENAISRVKLAGVALTAGIDQSGQDMVEYALILVLISVVAIAILATLGDQVSGVFNTINDQIVAAS